MSLTTEHSKSRLGTVRDPAINKLRPDSRRPRDMGLGRFYVRQVAATALPLLAVDVAVMLFCLLFSHGIMSTRFVSLPELTANATCLAVAGLVGTRWVFRLYPAIGMHPAVELKETTTSTLFFVVSASAMYSALRGFSLAVALMVLLCSTGLLIGLPVARFVARYWLAKTRFWGLRCLVVGGNHERLLSRRKRWVANMGYRIVGYVDYAHDEWSRQQEVHSDWPYLGAVTESSEICKGYRASTVIVTDRDVSRFRDQIRHSVMVPRVQVVFCHNALPCVWTRMDSVGGFSSASLENHLTIRKNLLLKRLMDVILVSIGGLVLLPAFGVIAVLIRISSPGSIFYSQNRVGQYGRHFRAWKFRTMVPNADDVLEDYLAKHPELRAEWNRDKKLKRDPRVTWIGRILRKTSLDELPQLWNVLVNDMSLVGPRPIPVYEERAYGDIHKAYALVLPGITGMWQISGRNNTSYGERIDLDKYYVRNWSLWLDLYILMRTVKTVAFGEGAY
ncbi:MAG: undecaprenyl-phosphate galactose phosphotransferase WbaP [Pirellulaceae bacterium]|nr:undecaprenyl-phosphate galactose phosphotransferase WbaP [Planctomycetales bacterium]